ncbi:hypothetical protein A8C32_06670 [Flavivirga aquatica]|uniref:YhhN-like protein n=1 Tax=Flavivirga aquatica TaxID=1849968 RepID=A0A1E5SIG8_9FLAO|nr:hypothetical protein A8C32_06670 [Flavivirga aquatica]
MIERVFLLLGSVFLLVNTILYFRAYNKNISLKIFTFYLLTVLVVQLVFNYLYIMGINNLFLSHFYFIFQFVFLSLFYWKLFKTYKNKRIVEIVFIGIMLILAFQYVKTPSIYFKFNLLEIILTSLSIVSFSVMYFYNALTEKIEYAYVNYGIFIYLISSTLIFCSGNLINVLNSTMNRLFWILNSVLFIVYQVLIFIQWHKIFKSKI